MSTRSAYVTARVEPAAKKAADIALKRLGLSTSDAINLFLHQVALHKGLPFEVRLPNAETRSAIKEIRDPKLRARLPRAKSVDDLFDHLLK